MPQTVLCKVINCTNRFDTGRQSLTRLAAFIAECNCFQIELSKAYGQTDWKEDIKKMMLTAGLMKRETVFIFSDTQVKKFFIISLKIQLLYYFLRTLDKDRIVSGRSQQHVKFWRRPQYLSTRRVG